MTYRPDESFPEGVTVHQLVSVILGMALVAVLYLMVKSDPEPRYGEQTEGSPVPVTIPRAGLPR